MKRKACSVCNWLRQLFTNVTALGVPLNRVLGANMLSDGKVRPFLEQDRTEVVLLWKTVFAEDPPWNEPNSVIDRKLLVQPELFLVYELGDAVVGTVIAGFDGFRGWIHHVAVQPSHQGKGIARQLLETAESGLQLLGCQKVNLQVRDDNTQAVVKYKKLGFSEEARVSMGKLL